MNYIMNLFSHALSLFYHKSNVENNVSDSWALIVFDDYDFKCYYGLFTVTNKKTD